VILPTSFLTVNHTSHYQVLQHFVLARPIGLVSGNSNAYCISLRTLNLCCIDMDAASVVFLGKGIWPDLIDNYNNMGADGID